MTNATFATSYVITPHDTVPGDLELAQLTGDIMTRPVQTRLTRDVLDEDGNPTGEVVFDRWKVGPETEDVETYRGGFVLVGSSEDGGDVRIVQSTEAILDQLAAMPDVLEIARYDLSEGGGIGEPVPSHAPRENAMKLDGEDDPKTKAKRDKHTKLTPEKRAKIAEKLAAKGMTPLPESCEQCGEVIEHVFGQYVSGWRHDQHGMNEEA